MINLTIYILISIFVTILYSALVGFEFGLILFIKSYSFLNYTISLYLILMFIVIGYLYNKIISTNKDLWLIITMIIYFTVIIILFNILSFTNISHFINFYISLYMFYFLGVLSIILNLSISKKTRQSNSLKGALLKAVISISIGLFYYFLKSNIGYLKSFLINDYNALSQIFILSACILFPVLWVISWIITYSGQVYNRYGKMKIKENN